MAKRIFTITSGKGGVGKTTLAINLGLAMSRYGKTVLIDQDLETGSVRSFLNMDFPKDLYHFIAQNTPLNDCIAHLPSRWDPEGRYKNFGLIAAPRHFIDDFQTLLVESRQKFIDAIHNIDADVVIIDMPAGLSRENVRTMPYSNSGILVFTPRLPAAAGAAANLIKAQIFRKLGLIIQPPSPLVAGLESGKINEVLELFHRADDVYDDEVPNLDAVLLFLHEKLGDHPVTKAIQRLLESFKVHYVLNHFDGVADSYENAVRPFAEQLADTVSARLDVRNLGWVEFNPELHDANCRRIPALLYNDVVGHSSVERHRTAIQEIENMVAGLEPTEPSGGATAAGVNRYLTDQLTQLEKMHQQVGSTQYPTHFEFLAAAAKHRMQALRPYSFGDTRILTKNEIHEMMLKYYIENKQSL